MKNIYYSSLFYSIIIIKTLLIGFLWEGEMSSKNIHFKDRDILDISVLFFMSVIIETLLFNLLLYFLLRKINILRENVIFLIIISGFIFGLTHFTNFENMRSPISSFISGIFYNLNFIFWYKRTKNVFKAVLSTFSIHFVHNITIYLIATNY